MLLEPLCPEECNTTKTASLQKKKKKKLNCDLLYAVSLFFSITLVLVLCYLSLYLEGFAASTVIEKMEDFCCFVDVWIVRGLK